MGALKVFRFFQWKNAPERALILCVVEIKHRIALCKSDLHFSWRLDCSWINVARGVANVVSYVYFLNLYSLISNHLNIYNLLSWFQKRELNGKLVKHFISSGTNLHLSFVLGTRILHFNSSSVLVV